MAYRRRDGSNDSSDDDESYHARKRRRHTDQNDIEERLESLITRVCEKSASSLESNLEGLTTVLEADMSNYKSKILKILLQCVVTMPENLTVYTTLVGLLNAKNYNAGGEFVELLIRRLKEALKAEEFDVARTVLRFLSDLVNCRVVTVASLISLYRTFLEVTTEIDVPQVRSDWYMYAVLSCLPWVGLEVSQKKPHDMESLCNIVEAYIRRRQKIHVSTLRVWGANESPAQEEYLDHLWEMIKGLRTIQWEESDIIRPYVAFEGILCDALQHTIPALSVPPHGEDSSYPLPTMVFTMFIKEDIPPEYLALPERHSLQRYLVEEYLHRSLHTFHLERKDCADALLALPIRQQNQNQNADSLVTVPVKDGFPVNYMIVEAVFSQIFQLPRPPYIELFYGSLLIELCKLMPSSMPQVLAQATEIIYEKLDTMNTMSIERFSSWFSYHLSNFQFKWSWDDWGECLEGDIEQPRPKFIRETLLKCLRLSYHQRVTDIMPASFEKLLPARPEPHYKYDEEEGTEDPAKMVAHKLMLSIKSKCTPGEAEKDLDDLPTVMDDGSTESFNPLRIEVFVKTLLFLGAKSFSHSFAAISKFHPLLKSLGESDDEKLAEQKQICILNSVHELWSSHQQMIAVLVDKLLKTQIVQCSSVASWIFSSPMYSELTSWYVWEILHSTIKKMNMQVQKLSKDIDTMKRKLREHDRKKRDADMYDMDDEEPPTIDGIDAEEDKLDDLQSSQKDLFIIIFQRMIMLLSDHLNQCEAERRDFNTPWYKWMIERLQQIFLLHHEQVYKYISTLESLMFTSHVDQHILEVFQQFCALRS